MLRVTMHNGKLAAANHNNMLDWLDISYERLAPVADYKVQLFKYGLGAECRLSA